MSMTTYLGRGGRGYQRWQDRQLGIRRPPRAIPLPRCVMCGRKYDAGTWSHCADCRDELSGRTPRGDAK